MTINKLFKVLVASSIAFVSSTGFCVAMRESEISTRNTSDLEFSSSNLLMRMIGLHLNEKAPSNISITGKQFPCPLCYELINFETTPVQVVFGCGRDLYLKAKADITNEELNDIYNKLALGGHIMHLQCAKRWMYEKDGNMICPCCKSDDNAYFLIDENEVDQWEDQGIGEFDNLFEGLKWYKDQNEISSV